LLPHDSDQQAEQGQGKAGGAHTRQYAAQVSLPQLRRPPRHLIASSIQQDAPLAPPAGGRGRNRRHCDCQLLAAEAAQAGGCLGGQRSCQRGQQGLGTQLGQAPGCVAEALGGEGRQLTLRLLRRTPQELQWQQGQGSQRQVHCG
jgi:hypothetical protein